ncbi:unnamed protein product [Pipistrellus nathusii]|uniref:Uncharacterized protein n=1 Tax=Pipistrellus nathusii TaxID=59473 RepID=A0ABN9Z8W2_PIPNA
MERAGRRWLALTQPLGRSDAASPGPPRTPGLVVRSGVHGAPGPGAAPAPASAAAGPPGPSARGSGGPATRCTRAFGDGSRSARPARESGGRR